MFKIRGKVNKTNTYNELNSDIFFLEILPEIKKKTTKTVVFSLSIFDLFLSFRLLTLIHPFFFLVIGIRCLTLLFFLLLYWDEG